MKKKILECIQKEGMDIHTIAEHLNLLETNQLILLTKEINKMIDEGLCFEKDGIIYIKDNYLEGIVDVYKGKPYIDDKPVNNDLNTILFSGDKILYRENRFDVDLIKIIERKTAYVYGTMVLRKGKLYFFSDDIRLKEYKVVNEKDFKKELKPFFKVRCFVSNYQKKELKIDKVIGHIDDEETLIETILLQNDAPLPFSNKIMKYCDSISDEVILDNRKDLRELNFITIDGDDAKDYDDAIYVEQIDVGYRLYVSIADVSHYVPEGSSPDKEAFNRGTSIYYPGKVIPMLPFKLSDDLCSLMEGKDRYTITCQMDVDYNGEVVSYEIYPSVICSKHRMTYSNVNKILSHDKKLLDKYRDITNMIYNAYSLSRIANKVRRSKGGIEFESNEPIIIEEKGKVVDIQIRKQDKAELMIEDFMILANTTVASHMAYLGLPLIYRNHDYPKQEKIDSFINTMEKFGVTFKGNPYKIESKVLSKCLEKFEDSDDYYLVSEMLLRCMAKALYSHNCSGHYGLGLEHYCHFTSPIRRYPDLIVHRMLKKYVFSYSEDIDEDNIKNENIAKKANEREKKATTIERAIVDLKMCEYMSDKIKQTFMATICSITNYGFYVRLENGVEGLVHIKNLDGYFYLDHNNNLSDDFGTTYKISQRVKVKLIAVDLNNRNIDFVVVNTRPKR